MECRDCVYYSKLGLSENMGQCERVCNGVDDPFVFIDDTCRIG